MIIENDPDNHLKELHKSVTSQFLTNQACLFGRSLITSFCEIFDNITAFFLLSKQYYEIVRFSLYRKDEPIKLI